MAGELSLPRNIQPLPDIVQGTDRVAAAMPKRDRRAGRGRPFDLGAHRKADEGPSGDGAPAEQNGTVAEKHPPLSADSEEKHLDYQA